MKYSFQYARRRDPRLTDFTKRYEIENGKVINHKLEVGRAAYVTGDKGRLGPHGFRAGTSVYLESEYTHASSGLGYFCRALNARAAYVPVEELSLYWPCGQTTP